MRHVRQFVRLVGVLAISILSRAAVATAADLADAPRTEIDPTTAAISAPPPLVDQFTEIQYARRYKKALQSINDVSPAPHGARITLVKHYSPAATALLHMDDVIVAIDGKPTPNADSVESARRAATDVQTFEIVPFDGSPRRYVKINLGHIGIDVDDSWRLEDEYRESLPTGVAPVDEVRVAARYAASDPLFAESALIHAQKAGGPGTSGPMINAIAAVALYNDGWFERALAYATAAQKDLPQDWRPQMDLIILDSAIATFRLPLAASIAQRESRYSRQLATVTEEIADYQKQQHTIAEPDPSASKLSFTDHTQDATNCAPKEDHILVDQTNYFLWYIGIKHTIPFSSGTAMNENCYCGPAASNERFSAQCHFTSTDDGNSEFSKTVRFGVANSQGEIVKLLELFADGTADMSGEAERPAKLNLRRLIGGGRQFAVQMSVVGDRYEATIDGRRVFYGPLPALPAVDKRQLLFFVQVVGLTGSFTDVKWETAGTK